MYDRIIRGETVIDGSGRPGYHADMAVQDGGIARSALFSARPGVS